MTIKFSKKIMKLLEDRAEELGISLEEMVKHIVIAYFEKKDAGIPPWVIYPSPPSYSVLPYNPDTGMPGPVTAFYMIGEMQDRTIPTDSIKVTPGDLEGIWEIY